MDEVIVRYMDMPIGVKGFVAEDSAGDYNVYLNSRQAGNVQMKTYRHELTHIDFGDLNDFTKSVKEKEKRVRDIICR